jgi:hypothetical protein
VPAGSNVNIDITFRGQIIDVCDVDAIVAGPNDWRWAFNRVV